MTYKDIRPAVFIRRDNRFVATILIDGKEEICHVKNTGRCEELFIKGAKIYVEPADNPNRKTQYSLIAIEKGNHLFNIDSQAPNQLLYEMLLRSKKLKKYIVQPEYTYKDSRFDFFLKKNDEEVLIEAKGVTLEGNNIACFPDAPTERGIKHMEELIQATKEGYKTYIIFVIQFEYATYFTPNYNTHPEFGETLIKARENGVNILALDTYVRYNSLEYKSLVPIYLEENQSLHVFK